MALAIEDAVEEVRTLLDEIDGLYVPAGHPPDSITQYPFAIISPGVGEWTGGLGNQKNAVHTISIEIHQGRTDLPRDITAVIDYGEDVANKLLANQTLNSTVNGIETIRYVFGPLGYGSTQTIGWDIELDVVIRTTHT